MSRTNGSLLTNKKEVVSRIRRVRLRTNNVVCVAHGVFAANTKSNASNLPNIDSLSDAVIYSFFASQSNNPQLDNENLKQIDLDDLNKMDLKWQMVMLTMRARRFLQKTGRNLGVKGIETIGFDNTKVEYYNCHIRGHFARKCKALKQQDNENMEVPRRNVLVEDTTSNTLVSQCDGLGYDWSDHAEEGPINFVLMAYTSSSSSSTSNSDTEARLEVYKKNATVYEKDIEILKLDVMFRDKALAKLRQKFEKVEKERDDLKLKLEKSESSSKNLSRLLDSQLSDKSKASLGYDSQGFDNLLFDSELNVMSKTSEGHHAVPYTGNFMPPKPDLVFTDEHVVCDNEEENEPGTKSKLRKPSFAKVNFVKPNEHLKTPRESLKKEKSKRQSKYPRKNSHSPRVLGWKFEEIHVTWTHLRRSGQEYNSTRKLVMSLQTMETVSEIVAMSFGSQRDGVKIDCDDVRM
nr:hypothetical protein [Tanacetum cinerariifolium]